MKNTCAASVLLLFLSGAQLACGDPIKFAQTIEETRVLGVRVQSESGFSSPEAGQAGLVEMLVAGPQGPHQVRVAYQFCTALQSSRGVPICGQEPFASGKLPRTAAPAFAFEVPSDEAADSRLAVLAVACTSGEPEFAEDPQDWFCKDNSEALRFSFTTKLAGEQEELNLNPELDQTQVWAQEQSVELEPEILPPQCSGNVQLSADKNHSIRVLLPETARQSDAEESLQISHFSTAGRYERQFTIIEPSESLDFEIDWKAPKTEGPVKNFLVVRDGRGGVSWLSWSLCVE